MYIRTQEITKNDPVKHLITLINWRCEHGSIVLLSLFQMIELQSIQNREEQVKILRACHIDPTAGHMGIKKTVSRITECFMRPGDV